MSNEEKILAMLEKMQADIDALKIGMQKFLADTQKDAIQQTPEKQLAMIESLANLLTQEERDEFGRYCDAEERIKDKVVEYRNQLWQEERKNWERQDNLDASQNKVSRYA